MAEVLAVAQVPKHGHVTIACHSSGRYHAADLSDAMIRNVARCLGCDPAAVNIKGKTHEGVDAIGEGRAIEVHAVVLLTA